MEEQISYQLLQRMSSTSEDMFVSAILIVGMGGVGKIIFIDLLLASHRDSTSQRLVGFLELLGSPEGRRLVPSGSASAGSLKGPESVGSYNSKPHETGFFFLYGGEYDSFYGRFFLHWYSKVLIDHGDGVLGLAALAFKGTPIAAKLSGIHWWYKTDSHAAELTAGFYNHNFRVGYPPIASMLKKHEAALNFTGLELSTL